MTQSSPRKVTRADVARLAGVSDAVVSYTLNGGAPVAPATAQRVREAVATLGYRPNQAARALKSGSASTLVLVVPDGDDPVFANAFFSEFASAIEAAARRRGYALYTTASSLESEQLLTRFHEFASRQVDGVLVLPAGAPLDVSALDAVGIPWLQLNTATPQPGLASLGVDLRAGAIEATRHLIEHGHRSIGYVGEPNTDELRYLGWMEACTDAGVAPGPFIATELTRIGGYRAGLALAVDDDRPSALFVASDRTALGLLRAFHERRIDVPGDVAMVAFDGSWETEYSWPALSSVRQPIEAMADSAVRRVLERSDADLTHEVFAGELVLRNSCGQH
ncbi:LacI family transcriptional regulator [Diaminobutyricimonas aerilata]|uniref:LacI family transcriptional regulator n=1 Tax=Diaminobutyricimonas aerilata TaxID=1162967 RepID=A0A2M9CJL8_9MICO|nr:LacI family DNA-binding transcriptional regulator [Diaminobutyricimonas aerilata]PJJ72089.1 LacI family transcriptional regulator [Diaminobutyricimonas aerilata]